MTTQDAIHQTLSPTDAYLLTTLSQEGKDVFTLVSFTGQRDMKGG